MSAPYTTRDLLTDLPLPDVERAELLAVLDGDGWVPNAEPLRSATVWPAWLALAGTLNLARIGTDQTAFMMSNAAEVGKTWERLDKWVELYSPLLRSTEPFGKWHVDPVASREQVAEAVASLKANSKLLAAVEKENARRRLP